MQTETKAAPTWSKAYEGVSHLGRLSDDRSATIVERGYVIEVEMYSRAHGHWAFQITDCDTIEEAHRTGARWVIDGRSE